MRSRLENLIRSQQQEKVQKSIQNMQHFFDVEWFMIQ